MQGWQPWVAAAATSGSMSAAGDVLAQALERWHLSREGKRRPQLQPARTARMLTFGLFFYGPFQHWWYGSLSHTFPGKAIRSFLIKVTLNQIVLGPIVLTTAFAWNLWLQGLARSLSGKLERDLVPTLITGWKFWVPAACINFFAVPLQFQVLYMSICGVIWTAYISFASYHSANAIAE
jgi:protein Mpv17